ncbi:hypothetical protein DFH08DRAFT_993703 [Mycena albidolilacea]|uniref:Nephrocystin 3-like N-terminal domain-containing protein n=1 Tax=Mycena albidolilacea TaxID=1033008 RepID=A0AAD6YY44_9AGAR|nr:hypothetical protein DFH08DRAFT_993703 [Mycena albidolilacea]
MAEALGIVGSIIQLVDTALKTRDYVEGFRNAPQEQKKLLAEMEDLRPLLGELLERITATPDMGQQHRHNHGVVLGSIDRVAGLVNAGVTNFPILAKQLPHEIKQIASIASSMRYQMIYAITGVLRTLSSVNDVANTVNSGVATIGDAISDQQERINFVKRTQIIDFLSAINFFLRQAVISRARQAGTGEWLLAHPRFQEWKSSTGRTLWCYGIPGAGKTVLASIVVDHLSAASQVDDVGVACIYLSHKEAEQQTPARLMSGLWRQLVLGRDVGSVASKLYQQHCEKGTTPSLDEAFDVLRFAVVQHSKVYIIVDAIDEYPEAQRRILLQYLAMMGSTVGVMITSRPHITADVSLPNLSALEIRATEEDIGRYVDAQIEISPRLSKHVQIRPELRKDIHSKITDTVDGMFLLAKLHAE